MTHNASAVQRPSQRALPAEGYLVSKGHSHYVLFLLFMLMAFDFIDRQVLAALLPYIKAEWALSDTQLGALVSAVNVAIAILAFPTAVVVDRWSRTKSIGLMAMLWSLATAACSFASSFNQMLIARFFIGTGEAGYVSGGNALLAAVYPQRMRATVIGIFQSASMVGTVLGVVLGGIIATHWGWRSAFGVVAVPGLLLAALVYFVSDYKTVVMEIQDKTTQLKRAVRWTDIAISIVKSPILLLLFLGQAAQLFFVSTLGNWLPSFFNRTYGMPVSQAGIRTGLVMVVAAVGMALGGYLIDRMTGSREQRRLLGPALFSLATAVLFMMAFNSPAGLQQTVLLFAGAFFMLGIMGPVVAAMQDVVHPGMRASCTGATALCTNLFGMALGPVSAGFLSDMFELQTALMLVSCAPLIAAVAYLVASYMFESELIKAHKVNATPMTVVTS